VKTRKPTKRPAAKKPAAKKSAGKSAAKGSAAKAPAKLGKRADFGKPIVGFFARQPPALRPILEELRRMVDEAAPDAASSIKWGMPFYTVDGAMMCALGAHKAHVNLILSGPPEAFDDPEGRLSGDGKTGRHLKLTSLADLPRGRVKEWLRAAAGLARKNT